MGNKFLDLLTPLMVVQAILSVIVVGAFVYQEIAYHSVDGDLKLITFGIVGFWLGGLTFQTAKQVQNGVNKNG